MTNPVRLLLADDETDICRFVEAALRPHGIETQFAYDGVQALDVFKKSPFDIVVTDVRMPRCTGFQLLQAIKAIDPTMPVLLCSAYTNDFRIISDAHKFNPDGLITKPFELDEMLEKVQSLARVNHSRGAA